jgi:hypothetical protein
LHNGRVLALQFHPEVTRDDLVAWIQEFDGDPSAHVQDEAAILATPAETFTAGHALLYELLDAIYPK